MLSLFDAVTRHQVYIERHKAHIAESFNDFLIGFDKKLKERMRDVNITAYSRNRMEALAAHVKEDMIDAYGAHYGVWREQIVDFAEYEAGHQARKLNEAFGVEFTVPARAQLRKAVLSTPLSGIGGPNKADMLHAFYKSWAGSRVRTVEAIIYGGYYQGLTNTQIVNQIRGTKLNRFKDGQIAAARKDVELLTRTAVQHAATQARMEVYDANADVIGGIRIVATLDDRTTPQCRSMDGRVFRLDEEHIPLPPYHVGCRSTTVPVMRPPFDALDKGAQRIAKGPDGSELVPADMTYYEWLKTQPAAFQNDAIGPRRAELLRNGGLSAKRFSELNLSRNFQPLTLEEMKRLEPGAFEKVEKSLHSGEESGILSKRGTDGSAQSTYRQTDIQRFLDEDRYERNQEPDKFLLAMPEKLSDGGENVMINEEKVTETLRRVELSMKDVKGYEVGAIIGRDGEVVKEGIKGKKDSIGPPSELVKDNIFSHTHHNGFCNLSDTDVSSFIIDEAYEVRVVTSDGRFVSLKRGSGGLNTFLGEDMKDACNGRKFIDEVNRRTMEKYGRLDNFQRNREIENLMNEWLSNNAEKYGYSFTQGRHEL